MKMKLYYGVIALLWLLSSCDVESTGTEHSYARLVIDNHEYIDFGYGKSHSGSCKQCKYELDSIVKNAVSEAFEEYWKEDWNE